MYTFFVTVHARPPGTIAGAQLELHGRKILTQRVPPETLNVTAFACSFETVFQRLGQLGRMYCEPDGSFVWVSPQGTPTWQVDGNLYDRDERLLFADLKGSCPSEEFDRLLGALGWPATPVLFQLTREAVFLDEAEFRRWAAGAALL